MYVVTGGAGFIGSVFLRKLNDEGVSDILVVDNLGSSDKWKNLVGKRFIDYIHKDELLEKLQRAELTRKLTAIVHLGACSDTTERDVDYLMKNNLHYSKALAEYAHDNKVRFIYASSAATYGNGDQGYTDNEGALSTLRPLNAYGFSKHLFDLWLQERGWLRECAGIKFFNVFGPNEYHKGFTTSLACKAVDQIRNGGTLSLFKSYRPDYAHGEQKRDFVYVKDCCDVLWWLVNNHETNGLFNLGTGQARSWNDLAKAVFSAMGAPAKIDYVEMPDSIRSQYQYFTEATMARLRGAGYEKPFMTLEESVKDYVQGYLLRENRYL